jgi:hypothetical protein
MGESPDGTVGVKIKYIDECWMCAWLVYSRRGGGSSVIMHE